MTETKPLNTLDPETTLVVVDMQVQSEAANDAQTLASVKQLIELAMSKGWGIVFLEIKNQFEDPGKTFPHLLDLVKDYDKWRLDVKPEKDGSDFVESACRNQNFGTGTFVICGVNLDACVVWTANGIARYFPGSNIQVVTEACNSLNPHRWETWDSFVAHDNIVVVSSNTT